jgi:hypothetical protein
MTKEPQYAPTASKTLTPVDQLEVDAALYAEDAKRCWELMPEMANSHFELSEAVAELVSRIKQLEFEKENAVHRYDSLHAAMVANYGENYGELITQAVREAAEMVVLKW